MDLSYTEEQLLLRDSVQKFISDKYDISERNKITATEEGFSRENWQLFADLGWLALPFKEEDGGIGGSPVDTMVLMEEFGKGLVVEPYLQTVIMVGTAISEAGSPEQKSEIIPSIIDGSLIATFAYAEESAHHDLNHITTSATRDGDSFLINGTKSVVPNAQSAEKILVTTRTSGEISEEGGITLFLMDANQEGISREDYPTVDGLRASEITFTDTRVPASSIIGEIDKGAAIIEKIARKVILALSAESVGAMEVLYKDTIEYTKQRVQFDHPLSDFQVLKHRMTEMFMEYSLAKSLCMKAAMLETQDSFDASRTVHALKYLVGKNGRFVSQNAVQLHGGMGMTEDLRIAHYFKRLMIIDSQFGNTDHHLARFVA
ncbi:MAG: pimeloyl-CoA dehydrogenase small subunit [Gammaproteobacteria bacterium]|jgi:alkylation response protein AidB-like acyl-CoA dehydrogenase|nr:pimeloyl-CoA dehydrogenase small subunit [Gammaproteobacteria bacterium]|tara:strand:+ start:7765 stop:8889 length:1125 start_codon:yes stop_codon:yes gene_type:complete